MGAMSVARPHLARRSDYDFQIKPLHGYAARRETRATSPLSQNLPFQ